MTTSPYTHDSTASDLKVSASTPEFKAVMHQGAAICGLYFVLQLVLLGIGAFIGSQSAVTFPIGALLLALILAWAGPRLAEAIRWLANLALAGFALAPVALLLQPLGLTQAFLRLAPWYSFATVVDYFAMLCVTWRLIQLLDAEPVRQTRAAHGLNLHSARIPRTIGAVLAIVVPVAIFFWLRGDSAQHAATLARQQFGPGYQYHVIGMSAQAVHANGQTSERHVGTVTAWNDTTLRTIAVSW